MVSEIVFYGMYIGYGLVFALGVSGARVAPAQAGKLGIDDELSDIQERLSSRPCSMARPATSAARS